MDRLLADIRYALREYRKSLGFTLLAIITLALGIGANTAIFSVVNAALLRALPFQNPERLVQLWHVPPAKSFPGMTRFSVSAANYVDWRDQSHTFEHMSIYAFAQVNLSDKGHAEALNAASVSQEFFSVLGSQPILGRTFAPDEEQPGHGNEVILGNAIWQSHFGGNRGIVGRQIQLNGESYTVVGVMPAGMRFPSWAQMWMPLAWTGQQRAVRGEHHYGVIGLLKPGVNLKQAQAEMDAISRRLELQYPADDKGWGAVVVPMRDEMVGNIRPALLVLLGAVAFVLLIACANVANLFVAKALARRKEIAIRIALGASRSRILRQIVTETTMLSVAGGALGLALSPLVIGMIVVFLADRLPPSIRPAVDASVLLFALAISILTGVLAGLIPGWRLTRYGLNEAMKAGLGRTDSDTSGNRTRSVLVVFEVALSLVLLVGAGLMIRSLWRLRGVDPGFDARNVLTLTARVSHNRFPDPRQQSAFFDQVLQGVRALPGVDSAGAIDALPMDDGSNQPVAIEGTPKLPMSEQPEVAVRAITPGYLRTMRIPLLQGRDLSDDDTADRPAAILISESMARRFWPNENPIGKHLTMSFFPDRTREVVGVVGDVKQRGLDVAEAVPSLYTPLAQLSTPLLGGWQSFPMTLVVRTHSRPEIMATAATAAVHAVDQEIPTTDVMSLEAYLSNSLSERQMSMVLLGSFAGLALLLASIGIYSVLSYAVRRRVPEIGIRMALGAQTGDVLAMILWQGAKLVAIGVGIGIAVALGLSRLMASQLFGITATDPLTFLAVAALLMAVAIAACYLPALRATRVNPVVALRFD